MTFHRIARIPGCFKPNELCPNGRGPIPSDTRGRIFAGMPIDGKDTIGKLAFASSSSGRSKILNILLENKIQFIEDLRVIPRSKLRSIGLCEATIARIEDVLAVRYSDFQGFQFDPTNSPLPEYTRIPLSYK